MDCPFCSYGGPSRILRDYGEVIVFEPFRPVMPGHVLVVPKQHAADAAVNPELTGRVFACAARWIADRDVGACNIITSVGAAATQTVHHLHVHVVPRRDGDGLALPWTA